MKRLLMTLATIGLVATASNNVVSCSISRQQTDVVYNSVQEQNFNFLSAIFDYSLKQPSFTLRDFFSQNNEIDLTNNGKDFLFTSDGFNSRNWDTASLKGTFDSSLSQDNPYVKNTIINKLNNMYDLKLNLQTSFDEQKIDKLLENEKLKWSDLDGTFDYGISNIEKFYDLKIKKVTQFFAINSTKRDDHATNFGKILKMFSKESINKIKTKDDLSNFFNQNFFQNGINAIQITFPLHDGDEIDDEKNQLTGIIKLDNLYVIQERWQNFLTNYEKQVEDYNASVASGEDKIDYMDLMRWLLNGVDLFNLRQQDNYPALILSGSDFYNYFNKYIGVSDKKPVINDYLKQRDSLNRTKINNDFINQILLNHKNDSILNQDFVIDPIKNLNYVYADDQNTDELQKSFANQINKLKNPNIDQTQVKIYGASIENNSIIQGEIYPIDQQTKIKLNEQILKIEVNGEDYYAMVYQPLNNTIDDSIKKYSKNWDLLKTLGNPNIDSSKTKTFDEFIQNYYVKKIIQPYNQKNQPISISKIDFNYLESTIKENLRKTYQPDVSWNDSNFYQVSLEYKVDKGNIDFIMKPNA